MTFRYHQGGQLRVPHPAGAVLDTHPDALSIVSLFLWDRKSREDRIAFVLIIIMSSVPVTMTSIKQVFNACFSK